MRLPALCLALGLLSAPALSQTFSPDQPIHDAARLGDAAAVTLTLKNNPNARDQRTQLGSQPIHLAAMNPDVSALRALIAAGANVNARDAEGATPLHMAAYASRTTHVQILLEAGADPLAVTDNGRDPTAMARKVKADETAGVLALWILKGCQAKKPC